MTPFLWGIVIGFVGFHLVYFAWFALMWYRTIHKDHREPEQIRADFVALQDGAQRLREKLQQSAHDGRN